MQRVWQWAKMRQFAVSESVSAQEKARADSIILLARLYPESINHQARGKAAGLGLTDGLRNWLRAGRAVSVGDESFSVGSTSIDPTQSSKQAP